MSKVTVKTISILVIIVIVIVFIYERIKYQYQNEYFNDFLNGEIPAENEGGKKYFVKQLFGNLDETMYLFEASSVCVRNI